MKITIIACMALLPTVTFAITPLSDSNSYAIRQSEIKILDKKGLVLPDSGVQIVPRSSLNIPIDDQDDTEDHNKSSKRAYELLHFKDVMKQTSIMEAKMFKPYQTYMRHNVDEMPFAYTYVGVPKTQMTEFIGIAPAGMYIKNFGWSGAVEFFKTDFATCAYTENNLNISHGGVRIAEEDVKYDVNGKISIIETEGNQISGWLYQVSWFDSNFIRTLECANIDYSQSIEIKTIVLAKIIDKA